jgi:hypothetical protein
MRNRLQKLLISLSVVFSLMAPTLGSASDHDDGEMDLKGRDLNLTDLFVFNENWQDPKAPGGNLILIMNTNPRSLARQQYYFSPNGHYEFHLSRVAAANKTVRPTGAEDVVLRLKFSAPDQNGHQAISLKMIRDGQREQYVSAGITTTLADTNAGKLNFNSASVDGQTVTVFAGLREDPFYFDVERYFRIRGYLATGVNTLTGPIQGGANVFRSDATAVDFAAGYNVNSIVLRVPISLLQEQGEPIFDVWETISVPAVLGVNNSITSALFSFLEWFGYRPPYLQIERLARPAINEGLVITNDYLNAFNSIAPSQDLSPAAAPVLNEAGTVLTKVHNYGVSAGLTPPAVSDVVAGFLPDVMRIDTRNRIAIGQWAYNGDAVGADGVASQAMLTSGRKLEDDVMDITLSYLIAGNPACGPGQKCTIPDGVTYSGGTDCAHAGQGVNPSNPGHKCLYGQTTRNGAAMFPFLASPN